MRFKLLVALLALTLTITCGRLIAGGFLRTTSHANSLWKKKEYSLNGNIESREITDSLQALLTGEYAKTEQARKALLGYAAKSSARRKEVIRVLMNNMDKPNLELEGHQSDYFLWREGSRLLGDLKATEALDLLVSHLDLTNGLHSASMAFQPAITGVLGIGSPAVPKLNTALQLSPNRNIRMAAAYCLTSIGGTSAMTALKQAQGSESNRCITHFIHLSLSTFRYKSKSGRLLFDDKAPQADIDARRNWLLAFQCIE